MWCGQIEIATLPRTSNSASRSTVPRYSCRVLARCDQAVARLLCLGPWTWTDPSSKPRGAVSQLSSTFVFFLGAPPSVPSCRVSTRSSRCGLPKHPFITPKARRVGSSARQYHVCLGPSSVFSVGRRPPVADSQMDRFASRYQQQRMPRMIRWQAGRQACSWHVGVSVAGCGVAGPVLPTRGGSTATPPTEKEMQDVVLCVLWWPG